MSHMNFRAKNVVPYTIYILFFAAKTQNNSNVWKWDIFSDLKHYDFVVFLASSAVRRSKMVSLSRSMASRDRMRSVSKATFKRWKFSFSLANAVSNIWAWDCSAWHNQIRKAEDELHFSCYILSRKQRYRILTLYRLETCCISSWSFKCWACKTSIWSLTSLTSA